MILASILISVLFALVFSALLVYGFGRRVPGPLNGVLFLFLIIFMFTWAVGSWVVPIGPVHWGVSWLGYLLIAILIMLLLGALLPPRRPRTRIIAKSDVDEEVKNKQVSSAIEITFGIFFWIMIIALFILAMIRIVD